ncbi:MAG TPA: A/G-specific adenine glycosylase [Ferruginibacter sp.]|nr:A/G-specific adenine glycosylase [Ferruginibacter sp.]HMP19411.1 A/G-specific adenine glycosylase [Ferruginibacter sp.]
MIEAAHRKYFVQQLLKWHLKVNDRQMPWKGEKDPYKIWLSEIILQQTRVEQGLAYYNRFIQAYPTIQRLASASEQEVYKLWEGLGYYSRCKNLIHTAKFITMELEGKFPATYEELLRLKGVGAYTAAAIASFAFGLPHAVVDGNVFRVLARYFNIDTAIDSSEGKKLFAEMANLLLDKKQPGIYNQAIMDFGAIVCTPRLPQCAQCSLNKSCIAFAGNTVAQLPVKEKTLVKQQRWLNYIVAGYKGRWYVRKRTAGDVWEGLYEFILVESDVEIKPEDLLRAAQLQQFTGKRGFEVLAISKLYRQVLTHQVIQGRFIQVQLNTSPTAKGYQRVTTKMLAQLPFPKFINHWLKDKNVSLNLL